MNEYEKELLIACGKAIKQLNEIIYIIPIPQRNDIDFDELEEAISDIKTCLFNLMAD